MSVRLTVLILTVEFGMRAVRRFGRVSGALEAAVDGFDVFDRVWI